MSSARRARYVDAFIANGQNYIQAARDINIRGESAQRGFAALMSKDPTAQAMIKARLEELAKPHAINAQRAVDILCQLVLADRRAMFVKGNELKDITELSFEDQLALDGFDVEERVERDRTGKTSTTVRTAKVKVSRRLGALDMLFKHFGLYAKDNAQRATDPEEVAARVREKLVEIDSSTKGDGKS